MNETMQTILHRRAIRRLGKIKRASSNPHMATATSYVSREQPRIADDPK